MGQQRHVIKRQTVEITLENKEAAWPTQQILSRLFQQYLPAIIDRCLSEASNPDCLHRIDCLELELGELDGNLLENEILERIDTTLRQALQEHIGKTQAEPIARQQDEKIHAHLQLFEHFVREGYLPWWADNTQSHAPEKSLTALLSNDPDVLSQLIKKLIQEPHCLQRLISYFDDGNLLAIMVSLTAAPKELATSLLQTLRAVEAPLCQLTVLPGSRIRFTLWQTLLQVAIAGEPVITRHAGFLTAVTTRWARLQGLAHNDLISCLQQLLSSQSVIDNNWLQAIKLLSSVDLTSTTLADEEPAGNISKTLGEQDSIQPKSTNNSLTEDITTPQQAHESAAILLLNFPSEKRNSPSEDQEKIETLDDNQPFSDADAIYINNAGLCILWPYLGAFFERLELVQNSHFHNPEAQQCAVSLLHYLATGELNPQEYLLPFNKVLCAMAIDEVFDLAKPLTDTQIIACDELLAAVIANAPILNSMSLNGFRGSFLLRQSSLSAEAGSWLLRVERETYDLVLDRFPWTWQWFKLPWMEHPIRVEW